ncbi:Glycosyl transferase, group 1 [hydrothermal vent metagenome]|uniref:Glycosyl transferase, group 1 n=1 Tax=hydrothermal vent metagenome TaxID=652676 RepID=A0A3B1BPI0_9ZZZZ
MNITLFTRSLDYGGAERQLVALANGMKSRGNNVSVTVFYPDGPLGIDIPKKGIAVESLSKRGRWDIIGFFFRLVAHMRRNKMDILHSYLTVPNILAVLLKPFIPGAKVVWGIRASNMDIGQYDWLSRFVSRLERMLSRFADLIIVNSDAGFRHSVSIGFPENRMVVIQNGIDTAFFYPDHSDRLTLRKTWGISDDATVIGLVARFDPMKDHQTFFRAANIFLQKFPDTKLALVGSGPDDYIAELKKLCNTLGISSSIVWTGSHENMRGVYNAFDIATLSSSFGEGFPNVIGEAMACGTPCVATDVGDSALIIGETGLCVPPEDPEELAKAWEMTLENIDANIEAIRIKIRERIETMFSRDTMIERSVNELKKLL